MKTLNIIVSDEVAEALRVEAERAGESTEQRLLAALDEGLAAAEAGDVVTLASDDVVPFIMDRYRRRVA